MRPAATRRRPSAARISVVLPAPLAPSMPTNSPSSTAKLAAERMSRPPSRIVASSKPQRAHCASSNLVGDTRPRRRAPMGAATWRCIGSDLAPDAARQQFAVALQHRIGGRGDQMRVDPLDVAQHVEMQRARLGRIEPSRRAAGRNASSVAAASSVAKASFSAASRRAARGSSVTNSDAAVRKLPISRSSDRVQLGLALAREDEAALQPSWRRGRSGSSRRCRRRVRDWWRRSGYPRARRWSASLIASGSSEVR